jgi:hypothetical protein
MKLIKASQFYFLPGIFVNWKILGKASRKEEDAKENAK